jgi:signal transduction histidine kinase
LFVADRPEVVDLAGKVLFGLTTVVAVAATVLVVRRYRTSTPVVRRALAPVASYSLFALLMIPLSARVIRPLTGMDPVALFLVQAVVFALVPVAFLLGVLSGGFGRTGEVVELGAWFRSQRDRSELTKALADTLGDPSVQFAFWLEEQGGYVDVDGAKVALPVADSGRSWSRIVLDGRVIGAIVYDEALVGDPALVDVAGQVLAIGLDRQRLIVELISSRDALRESRSRIVETDERVRRRLARNLHDGLQGRLVVLAIQAQRLTNQLSPGPEREQGAQLRSGLDVAIAELRGVVYDVMPALLIERGLPAATLEVVERMPIPTRLLCDQPIARLPATLESAAFFVIAEALANGLKHSQADTMSVSLDVRDDELRIEVTDDGVGGAVQKTDGGMRGVADRVEALGGRVRVESPHGLGTRMLVRLPCAS